jgi:alpha-methylacyl-CoA racemase
MKPFRDVHVVGLVTNLPGPLVLSRLAEMGARCIKVEPPTGDALQMGFPDLYKKLTQDQVVLKMDLKDTPKLMDLLEKAQLLVTTIRPKTLEKLGLGWKNLQEKFPKLSHLSIVGYGPEYGDRPGHDLTYQATKGFIQPPNMPITTWADLAGAQEATIQALALLSSNHQGQAQKKEVALADALDFFAIPYDLGLTPKDGVLGGGLSQYRIYQAQNGWVAFAAIEPHFLEKFKTLNQLSECDEETLSSVFLKKPSREWEEWAKANDLPLAEVKTRNA